MTALHSDDPPRQPASEPPADAGAGPLEPPGDTGPEPAPTLRRRLFRRRPAGAAEAPAHGPAAGSAEGTGPVQDAGGGASADGEPPARTTRPRRAGELRRRRRRLTRRRQESLYHLGGLAFELFRRDRLPDGVMRRRAEEVAEIDRTVAEIDGWLEEIDRERRERRRRKEASAAPAGACVRCRSPFLAGARFCWNCGVAFGPPPELSEQVTQVITAERRGGR